MVTKQQQLEWLAKECDEWPVNGEYFTMNRYAVGSCVHAHVITRKEWQQERDKMQKQDNESECAVMTLSEAIAHANEKSRELKGHCAANHALLAHWLTEYRSILSKSNQQNYPDNSWHERGELPPVGCECEWVDESGVDGTAGSLYPCVGDVVSVCAHRQTPGGDVIAIFTWEPGDGGLHVAASRMPTDFRPIRTEREKAIDAACGVICKNGVHDFERGVIVKLYDAGMLKK